MLSRTQIAQTKKFMTHFHIWESDLLECAKRWPNWRSLAHQLGFTEEKIDKPWEFKDNGRQIQYMEIPHGRTQTD